MGHLSGQSSDKSTPENRDKSIENKYKRIEIRDESVETISVSKDTVCRADVQQGNAENPLFMRCLGQCIHLVSNLYTDLYTFCIHSIV